MKKNYLIWFPIPAPRVAGTLVGARESTNGNASIAKAIKRGNLKQLPTFTAQTLQFDDIHILGIVSRGAALELHHLHSSAAEQTV